MLYTPLQSRKVHRLSTPWMHLAIAEVMGNASVFHSDSFAVRNSRNTPMYMDDSACVVRDAGQERRAGIGDNCTGEMIAGGLIDGCAWDVKPMTSLLTQYLSSAFQMHTIFPAQLRMLRGAAKLRCSQGGQRASSHEDCILDLLTSRMQRTHAMHRGDGWTAGGEFHSLVTESDMQQYALSADALCRAVYDTRCTTHAPDRRTHALCDRIRSSALSSSSHSVGQRHGCCASWFTATVAPAGLKRRHNKAVCLRPSAAADAHGGDGTASIRRSEAQLEQLRREERYGLDVMVSTLGNCRAFGLARHARNECTHSGQARLAHTTMGEVCARVVPLGRDHTPDGPEEKSRIVRAGVGSVADGAECTSWHVMRNTTDCGAQGDSAEGASRSGASRAPPDGDASMRLAGASVYHVARCFGVWSEKSDARLPLTAQKVVALPTCVSWEMLPGDVLVLSNRALYDTRDARSPTSIDAVAQLVEHELQRHRNCAQIASALCDFALRFGAPHGLQVLVAMAVRARGGAASCTHGEHFTSSSTMANDIATESTANDVGTVTTTIEPGALYLEAWRRSEGKGQLRAFMHDCERCGVSVAEMLRLRWERVRGVLSLRYALPYAELYGNECSMMQQIMDEEAELFDDSLLRRLAGMADLTVLDEPGKRMLDALFVEKAKKIESLLS